MTHRRAQGQLHINRNRNCECELLDGREFFDLLISERPPETCRHQRDEHEHPEECLRDASMKDPDLIFHHGNAKAAEDSLEDDSGKRNHAEAAHPPPVVAQPQPRGENDRKKSHERTHQTMRVLK